MNGIWMSFMTREEIEERMAELGRKFVDTRDKKITDELYELALELKRMEKEGLTPFLSSEVKR
jgi:hypothetical protein